MRLQKLNPCGRLLTAFEAGACVAVALTPRKASSQSKLALTGASPAGAAAPAEYAVVRHIPVGAAPGWDFAAFDDSTGRVFLTLGDHLSAIDPAGKLPPARIDGLVGSTHGVAFDVKRNQGYVSSGKTNSIVTFNLKTLEVIRKTPSGGNNPDAVLYLASTDRVYSFNGRGRNIAVIHPDTGAVEQVLPVDGKPEVMAADGNTLYLNLEDKAQVAVIDLPKLAMRKHLDLPGCEEPTGLAFDAAHQRVFSVCANGVLVVTDPASGKQVAKVVVGKGPDGVAYDAKRGLLFSTGGEAGTVSIVQQDDGDHYHLAQTLATAPKGRTNAYDAATGTLYIPVPGKPEYDLLVVAPKP